MVSKKEMDEIVLQEKQRSIHISRIPTETKAEFVKLAEEEFAGDYGLLLKWCLEQALEYQTMKRIFFENMDFKLNDISEKVNKIVFTLKIETEQSTALQEDTPEHTMFSGRKVKGGKKQI